MKRDGSPDDARPTHRPRCGRQLRQLRQEWLRGERLTGSGWEENGWDCADELAAAERAFKGHPCRAQRNHKAAEETF